jgi:hypothetical protein
MLSAREADALFEELRFESGCDLAFLQKPGHTFSAKSLLGKPKWGHKDGVARVFPRQAVHSLQPAVNRAICACN